MLDTSALIIAISASLLSGLATGLLATWREHRREANRRSERERDALVLEMKDLEIVYYRVQKDLDDWKNKYYLAIQELISVKAELEKTLIELTSIERKAD